MSRLPKARRHQPFFALRASGNPPSSTEGCKQTAVLAAEGQAEARLRIADARIARHSDGGAGHYGAGNPAQYLIAQRYLESLGAIANGADKVVSCRTKPAVRSPRLVASRNCCNRSKPRWFQAVRPGNSRTRSGALPASTSSAHDPERRFPRFPARNAAELLAIGVAPQLPPISAASSGEAIMKRTTMLASI